MAQSQYVAHLWVVRLGTPAAGHAGRSATCQRQGAAADRPRGTERDAATGPDHPGVARADGPQVRVQVALLESDRDEGISACIGGQTAQGEPDRAERCGGVVKLAGDRDDAGNEVDR